MALSGKKPVIVRQVFAEDLKSEFAIIQSAILEYPFVSMDTEFPGTIFKPYKRVIQEANPVINYQYMKSNVDGLKIIQLGLTLADYEGNLPDFGTPFCYIWEFNFKDFDMKKDSYVKESIELLKQQGIDFEKNKEKGIDSIDFSMMIWNSGLFNYFRGLNWITFHGAYDFGFLMRILTQQPLPPEFKSFMKQLVSFFGYKIFDIKHTFRFFGLDGGLEKVAKTLNVDRIAGLSHQAGSDSLLTLQCFMMLKKSKVFECNQRQSNRMLPALALYGLVSTIG
ncbi:probable CCR4-associated factor 1 homolog 11 [Durio zibethinus]|uniref:poly(A)-specific ribonuclease n=1 Tax=Durio zibethinus TaxID=66656 RepID=A0A6P5XAJ5_DURZI|nr:probable CCR4-associated factor 1 homolog 11 [Durio zibethinus]